MTSRPIVPRPSARDMGQLPSRWDTSRPAAGTDRDYRFNTWQKSEQISGGEWDNFCPIAVPDEGSNCPTPPLPSVALGQPAVVPWTVSDWHAFFDERLAIAHIEGELSLPDASRLAWLTCLQRWLERHPPPNVAPLVWPAESLRLARISEAAHALARLGIYEQGPEGEPASRRI